MTSSWLDTYMSALEVRDASEKANEATIAAYTKLADHTATLQKAARAHAQASSTPTPDIHRDSSTTKAPSNPPIPPPVFPRTTSSPRTSTPPPGTDTSTTHSITQLRTDLQSAQHARHLLSVQNADLISRFDSLTTTLSSKTDALQAAEARYATLQQRLKDREEELREKGKFLERVQDELLGMEMELNVKEREVGRLRGECESLEGRLVRERVKSLRLRAGENDEG